MLLCKFVISTPIHLHLSLQKIITITLEGKLYCGNIVGVVISQLNKRTFGSLVENVNFGIKASTVRQFLVSSGLSSKKSERTEEKSTEQLAEIAQNQALMVMCLQ